ARRRRRPRSRRSAPCTWRAGRRCRGPGFRRSSPGRSAPVGRRGATGQTSPDPPGTVQGCPRRGAYCRGGPAVTTVAGKRQDSIQITLPTFGTGPVVGVGLLLIVVSLAFRASVLSKAYFVEDDFLFVAGASDSGLTWDYLTRVHKGHLMPGALALVWLLTSLAPYSWALVSFVTIGLQAAASIMFLVLLRRLFGDRFGVLAALAVYVFAPLTVPAMSWWSAALNAVPLQLALIAAVAAHVRYVRTGQGRWRPLVWAAIGMAFSTK